MHCRGMEEINYINKVGGVERITRQQFLSDRKNANASGLDWCKKDSNNTLEVYVSVAGYGRRILASYRYTFGGVTDPAYGGYFNAARKDAVALYYTKTI